MEQSRKYKERIAKKRRKEVYPFWNLDDIRKFIEWFQDNNNWDGYLITMFELLLGRRIGDTVSLRWSDFYWTDGTQKNEMDTVVEEKTDKVSILPLTSMVFEAIGIYCEHTGINPVEHIEEDIFDWPAKKKWREMEDDKIYSLNDFDLWYEDRGKSFGKDTKKNILDNFEAQKKVDKTLQLGEYLYYVIEYDWAVKRKKDNYRVQFNKAVQECQIKGRLSTHSLRKSFGYWIFKLHSFDPNCIISLSKMFNHATIQQTTDYIGLTEERNRMYMEDHGEMVRRLMKGEADDIIKNMPVIPLKSDDFGMILMTSIKMAAEKDADVLEIYNDAINKANQLKIV